MGPLSDPMLLLWSLACTRPAAVPTAAAELIFLPGVGSRDLAGAIGRYERGDPVDPLLLQGWVLDDHDARIRTRMLELLAVDAQRRDCDDCYEAAILDYTDKRWDPDDLHQLGLDTLDAIDVDLEALRSRPVLSQEATLTLARPLTDCPVVEPAPAALGANGGYRRGTVALHPTPAHRIPTTLAHECDPGHHTAEEVGATFEGWPLFLHQHSSPAIVEGWAHYAEQLAFEEGAFEGVAVQGYHAARAWRAARVVVDTGMHHLGWTDDEARAFYQEHTALDDAAIARDLARHRRTPGALLSYTLGALELQRLRAHAEAELGERFELNPFLILVHHPGQSLPQLAADVDRWILEQR